ncbi:hypothetical protein U2F26_27300 [Micromonospora sp. 4G57]|uniref:Uncharacterized protein n=1 Tax=Micromonospora sicca TaxID=2202420 RepID=A0ABU5JM14_9ACTN|nr:hypothetical protein [Micromonospora sp. 4G53]MDZ5446397.1 hypothetical protein [Micromonospora sp. 4G57]MDZ5493414.1 hypothetical protein [Micromonospora sp. 4G53]
MLSIVSDLYIRLIPTNPDWQPTHDAAAAVAYVASLYSGPGDAVEEVEYEFYDRMTLIDAGENTSQIACSRCGRDIGLDWLGDLVRGNGSLSFDHLDVTVPCCGAVVPLNSLHYDWPIGFARFEVSAMNPTRAQYELDTEELARVADLLGHPVAQILTHY